MIALQLISLLFGLYMLYWSFLVYKKGLIYFRELIFWVSIWISFVGVSFFPNTTKRIIQTFKISRTMDLLMILSFILLWIVTFKNYTDNRQSKKKLQELVKKVAIDSATKKRSK